MSDIIENHPLNQLNTFGVTASARWFSKVTKVDDLNVVLGDSKIASANKLVLGGGSNILFTKDFDGLVLHNQIMGLELLNENENHVFIKAGSGVVWHELVMFCIKNNYGGLENLSLIPGLVGAAPIQNIGAYGVEQKDLFVEAEVFDLHELGVKTFGHDDCKFGYRDSVFKNEAKGRFMVTSVTYKLSKQPKYNTGYGAIQSELEKMKVKELSIAAVSEAICNIRKSKLPDPAKIGNAGSFFKNPVVNEEKYEALKKDHPEIVAYPPRDNDAGWKLAAGWMIEQCGWKGKSFGNFGVHKSQALVLVNYGQANGHEIFELSEKIIQSVFSEFGVTLEREVQII